MDRLEDVMESIKFGIISYSIIEESDKKIWDHSQTSFINIRIKTFEGIDYTIHPSPLGYQVSQK